MHRENEPDLFAAFHAEGLDLLRHPLLVLLLLLIALVSLVGDVADGWEECVFLVFWHDDSWVFVVAVRRLLYVGEFD